eukprot:12049553-Ditylum_brightwellii.AAC.1
MANLVVMATSATTNFAGVAANTAHGLTCVVHLIMLNATEYCRRCNHKRSRVFSIMFSVIIAIVFISVLRGHNVGWDLIHDGADEGEDQLVLAENWDLCSVEAKE